MRSYAFDLNSHARKCLPRTHRCGYIRHKRHKRMDYNAPFPDARTYQDPNAASTVHLFPAVSEKRRKESYNRTLKPARQNQSVSRTDMLEYGRVRFVVGIAGNRTAGQRGWDLPGSRDPMAPPRDLEICSVCVCVCKSIKVKRSSEAR